MSERTPQEKAIIAELWRRGEILPLKLHGAQMEIAESFENNKARKFVLNCARRFGKSTLLAAIGDAACRKEAHTQVKYAAPTAKAVRKIIKPLLKKYWDDCPKDLIPKWDTMDQCYRYPNGSEFHIAGTDQGNAENLRGTEAKIAIIDEAGFCDDLNYVIHDILLPQTLTTNGRIFIASTPPKTPGHEYVSIYLEAKARGSIEERTIYDNPMVSPEAIEEYMYESGGENSTTWQREYLSKFVTDQDSQILPEFTEDRALELIQDVKRPYHFDGYVAMDVGFEDLTFIIFGYWDFINQTLVIEDELVLQGREVRSDNIARLVAEKEAELWKSQKPYMRISDTEPILLNDLQMNHNLLFNKTRKDDKDSAINAVRLMISRGGLLINPRCTSLIAHMKYGVWDNTRKKFARTKSYGHFDGVDALIYLVRNLQFTKNPVPYRQADSSTSWVPPTKDGHLSPSAKAIRGALLTLSNKFGRKK